MLIFISRFAPEHRRSLHFAFQGTVYQFKSLPFGPKSIHKMHAGSFVTPDIPGVKNTALLRGLVGVNSPHEADSQRHTHITCSYRYTGPHSEQRSVYLKYVQPPHGHPHVRSLAFIKSMSPHPPASLASAVWLLAAVSRPGLSSLAACCSLQVWAPTESLLVTLWAFIHHPLRIDRPGGQEVENITLVTRVTVVM